MHDRSHLKLTTPFIVLIWLVVSHILFIPGKSFAVGTLSVSTDDSTELPRSIQQKSGGRSWGNTYNGAWRIVDSVVGTAQAEYASTSVTITICGDGIVQVGEGCDDVTNTGAYSNSISGRHCNPGCGSFAAYCGDGILQSSFGETCDDGNNASGDFCGATCVGETIPPSGNGGGAGFNPGSATAQTPTKVVVTGKAYPNVDVNVLQDGAVAGVVKADNQANFYFSTTQVTPGVATFGFWAEDVNGLRSVSFTTTFRIIANAVTTVSGAFLPPTITLDKRKLNKGEILNISGQSVPQAKIETDVNSESTQIAHATTTAGGLWKLAFDTSPLATEDFHTAKALFETTDSGAVIKSGFGQSVSFYVGTKDVGTGDLCGRADINKDKKVNLVDFSILLFNWGSSNGNSDINFDGKVNLTDFSIMLFCWTG